MGSDCGSCKYPLFSLLSFLRERKYAYEITTLFVRVFCAPSKISTFESKTSFHEMWCAHYATTGYPNIKCFNFLQLVITHAQTCEIGPTTVTLHPGPEILHGNRSLQYIPLPLSKFFVKCKTRKLWLYESCLAFGLMITTNFIYIYIYTHTHTHIHTYIYHASHIKYSLPINNYKHGNDAIF